jgi:hypothetical protein
MKYGEEVDLALIDADIIVYRSGFAAEHTFYTLSWDEQAIEFEGKRDLNAFVKKHEIEEFSIESRVHIEPLSHALRTVKTTISAIITATQPADVALFLTKGDNFRHDLATIAKYKGNRDNQRRPKHYLDIRKYLTKYYNTTICEGIEADDALADAQTDRTVLCSIDKDLLQVPGKHFNWVKNTYTLVRPETGIRNLWCQVLTGDKTDNIPGIFKVGPVTADKWLAECTTEEEMRAVCVEKWHDYLYGDSPPEWVIVSPAEGTVIEPRHYTSWNTDFDAEVFVDAERIVEEVYQMVKVGRR